MLTQPLVSVVMTVFRPDPVFFPIAVQSILSQTHSHFEFIIVEDPSDRPAVDLLARFRDERIRHICNVTRTSYLGQRNQSIALANSEYVATIDADDRADPSRIEKQLALFQNDRQLGLAGSQLEIIDASGSTIGWRRYPIEHESILATFPCRNPFAHPSVMYRRQAVLDVGGYRYDRFPANEDYDLWSRVSLAGWRLANHPEPLLAYRTHAASMKTTQIRGVLRGTREIKRQYWAKQMSWADRLRWMAEGSLIALPPSWTMKLFLASQYQRSPIPKVTLDTPP